MKKALLAIAAVVMGTASVHAQGTIIMKNIGVLTTSGSTYNIPLYASNGDTLDGMANNNSTLPAGTLSGGVTAGLYTAGGTVPLATGILGTTAQTGPFIFTPSSQTVTVTGSPAGSTPTLFLRAWSSSAGSFAAARITPGAQWGEWSFTTLPLGGDPGGGALPITPPTFTNLGNVNGSGFELNQTVPEPATIALGVLGVGAMVLARRRK